MLKQIVTSVLISFVIVIITGSILYRIAGNQANKAAKSANLSVRLADGEYQGAYYAFKKIPAARIRFTIRDNSLTNFYIIDVLTVLHQDIKIRINQAIGNQGLNFHAVTGATISSRFVQAAITDAKIQK